MLIVGLTGSLATGKSTVAAMLKKCGAEVVDCDAIAHDLVASRGEYYRAIVKHFGPKVLNGDVIDRRKLAEVVFRNSRELKKLTSILHPGILKEVRKKINAVRRRNTRRILVIDAPLLIEAGWHRWVDVLVVVKANLGQQIERSRHKRAFTSKADALRRIRAQMSIGAKLRLADMIIDNRSTLQHTEQQVRKIYQKLKLMSSS